MGVYSVSYGNPTNTFCFQVSESDHAVSLQADLGVWSGRRKVEGDGSSRELRPSEKLVNRHSFCVMGGIGIHFRRPFSSFPLLFILFSFQVLRQRPEATRVHTSLKSHWFRIFLVLAPCIGRWETANSRLANVTIVSSCPFVCFMSC